MQLFIISFREISAAQQKQALSWQKLFITKTTQLDGGFGAYPDQNFRDFITLEAEEPRISCRLETSILILKLLLVCLMYYKYGYLESKSRRVQFDSWKKNEKSLPQMNSRGLRLEQELPDGIFRNFRVAKLFNRRSFLRSRRRDGRFQRL